MNIKYELSYKIKGGSWKVFDKYKDVLDPDIKKYYNLLAGQKYNDGVRVIKIKTTRELIDFEGVETDE